MKKIVLLGVFIGLVALNAISQNDGKMLEIAFTNPPERSRPYTYWYWLSDNISKEGITKDLEAMAAQGIGEAFIGNIFEGAVPRGTIKVLTEQYWDHILFAIQEAERLGIKVGLFNCPGWSQSGGPWVKPEQTMHYLKQSEFKVKGPKFIKQTVLDPDKNSKSLIVQAFPLPKGEMLNAENLPAKITSTPYIKDLVLLFDGNKKTALTIPSLPVTIEIEFPDNFSSRSLVFYPDTSNIMGISAKCELQYLDKKGVWKSVTKLIINRTFAITPFGFNNASPIAEAFDEVSAKKFRIILEDGGGKSPLKLPLTGRYGEIELKGAAVLSRYSEKQLASMHPDAYINFDTYLWPPTSEPKKRDLLVDTRQMLDLTSKVDSQGVLNWDVPAGNWIILATCSAPTEVKNHPVSLEGQGYEIDKMSKMNTQVHFDAYIGDLLDRLPTNQRKGLRHVVVDSYESGSANWTEGFSQKFKTKYGYDMMSFMPVLSGRIINSAEQSDRFLWDIRRLVADLIASEYVGGLQEKCKQNGLTLWLENYGHAGFPGEFLNYGGFSDEIGGEFWLDDKMGSYELRCASSAANIYGKDRVSAESFTSFKSFQQMPRDLKLRGDWAWTQGINHTVFHVYLHQPDDRKPGQSAWFGTDFNRNSTWFQYSKPYFDYIHRSSAILQEGIRITDVAYLIGEDTPKITGSLVPKLPSGYDYDFINYDILMNNARVIDGRIVLSSGASYSLLVLPDQKTMRPELLTRIADLVYAGATIVGPKPNHSPSLQNYPKCDLQVKKTASQMWGKNNYHSVSSSSFGKGFVYSGVGLDFVLSQINVAPDVILPDSILFTHRQKGSAHIYFLSNQKELARKETISFRISGLQPELWNAETGEMRMLPAFTEKDGRTFVPLEFDPSGSYFIVFRNKALSVKGSNFMGITDFKLLGGPWALSMDTMMSAPSITILSELIDLSTSDNPSIKYYSGTATYKKEFIFEGDSEKNYFINLGKVEELAVVRLNGQNIGTAWHYPYRLNTSKYLKQGKNILEVDVVNTWWNRLVGDAQPNSKQHTWTAFKNFTELSPLRAAGMIGPVKIEIEN